MTHPKHLDGSVDKGDMFIESIWDDVDYRS